MTFNGDGTISESQADELRSKDELNEISITRDRKFVTECPPPFCLRCA